METIKHVICEVCGHIFGSNDGTTICPNCLKKEEPQEDRPDQTVLEPIIIDGDEDVDFDEDPDYDLDDNDDDDADDPFELDLDEDLFDDDY